MAAPDQPATPEAIRAARELRHRLLADPLVLRVFVDRSIVEVYANDRQAIGRSIYPALRGTGVTLFAEGADVAVESVRAWELMPSNPY